MVYQNFVAKIYDLGDGEIFEKQEASSLYLALGSGGSVKY